MHETHTAESHTLGCAHAMHWCVFRRIQYKTKQQIKVSRLVALRKVQEATEQGFIDEEQDLFHISQERLRRLLRKVDPASQLLEVILVVLLI